MARTPKTKSPKKSSKKSPSHRAASASPKPLKGITCYKTPRSSRPKRAPSAYNLYMKGELAHLKKENLSFAEYKRRFSDIASLWKHSKQNPKAKVFTGSPSPAKPTPKKRK